MHNLASISIRGDLFFDAIHFIINHADIVGEDDDEEEEEEKMNSNY